MIDIQGWSWVVDKNERTIRNVENEVTIKMEKEGKNLRGMLQDMPIGLFSEIAGYRDGEKIIEEIVNKAVEEYFRAHSGENKC